MLATRRTALFAALFGLARRHFHPKSPDEFLHGSAVPPEEAVKKGALYLRKSGFKEFSPGRELVDDLHRGLGLYKPAALWVRSGPRWEIQDRSLRRLMTVAGAEDHVVVDMPDHRLYYEIMPVRLSGGEHAIVHAYYGDGVYGAFVLYLRKESSLS
jgi:hypothetical protein